MVKKREGTPNNRRILSLLILYMMPERGQKPHYCT